MDSLKRTGRTLFFLINMVGSLIVPSGPILVSILDIGIVLSTFTCCSSCFTFRADLATCGCRGSLVDIPLLSLGRSVAALCAHALCGVPSLCHAPYLCITIISGICTTVLLSVKACMYENFYVSTGTPTLAVERRYKMGLPLLLVASAVFAIVHIFVAYKTRCQARRKLYLRKIDLDGVSSSKISMNGYQRVSRAFSPKFLRRNDLESNLITNLQQEENDLPAHLLADYDSLFMDVRGVLVHYKLIEGSLLNKIPLRNSYESLEVFPHPHSSSSKDSSGFSTTWNPLARPSIIETSPTSVDTPISRDGAGDYNFLTCVSSSWGNIPPAPHEWPASLHQTRNGSEIMPSVPSNTESSEFNGKTSAVIFIHGFGGGVFSWRHVMGTIAREVGCRVVAFDRPGWGLTIRPRRTEWEPKGLPNPYELQTQVGLLFAFCKQLGLTSVVLVGHSDGGLLALMAAAQALKSRDSIQVEVKGLVLVCVSLAREVVPSFARVLLHTTLGRHMLRLLLRSEIAQVTTRRAWHDSSKLTSETLDLYKAPLHVENWDKALSEVSKATMGLSTSSAAELLRCMADLPALVVAGIQDNLVPIKSAQSLTSQLPSSRLLAIPNCGHLPHEECPDALLSALIPFASRQLGNQAVFFKTKIHADISRSVQ